MSSEVEIFQMKRCYFVQKLQGMSHCLQLSSKNHFMAAWQSNFYIISACILVNCEANSSADYNVTTKIQVRELWQKIACLSERSITTHHEFNQVLLDKFRGIMLHLRRYFTETGARIKHLLAPWRHPKVQSISLNIFEEGITHLHFNNMFSEEQ